MMTTLSSLRAERMVVPCQGAALCAWGLVMPRDMGDRRRGRKGRAQASSGRPGQESAASLVDFDCRRVGEEYRFAERDGFARSEEHTSELQSLMRISYAVFCLQN